MSKICWSKVGLNSEHVWRCLGGRRTLLLRSGPRLPARRSRTRTTSRSRTVGIETVEVPVVLQHVGAAVALARVCLGEGGATRDSVSARPLPACSPCELLQQMYDLRASEDHPCDLSYSQSPSLCILPSSTVHSSLRLSWPFTCAVGGTHLTPRCFPLFSTGSTRSTMFP